MSTIVDNKSLIDYLIVARNECRDVLVAENLAQNSLSGTPREIKQTVTNRFDPV